MAKMTKSQLMASLAEGTGMSKKDVITVLDKLTEIAYSEVKKNGEFALPGFGKLVKKQRKARTARNPQTGATIQVPAATVVRFRIAKAAKESIL